MLASDHETQTTHLADPSPQYIRTGPAGLLRGTWRLLRAAVLLCRTWVEFRVKRDSSALSGARVMQTVSKKLLAIGKIPVTVQGEFPSSGLIVSNHLGYLDVLVLGSLTPAIFVSKDEVRGWPLIGSLVASIGTIFLKRDSIRAAAEVNRTVAKTIKDGLPVVFFPEGTTTGGNELLPFQPALFDGAVKAHQTIQPVAIRYTLNGGDTGVRDNVCYWGDIVFGTHLIRLLRLKGIAAQVMVAEAPVEAKTRGEAAERSHEAVSELLKRLHGSSAQDAQAAPPLAAQEINAGQ